jgi:hypothetical protein
MVSSLATLRKFYFAKGITIARLLFLGDEKTQVMRTLKIVGALAAAALIIGQVGTAGRVASESKTNGMPMSLNVKPLQVLERACGDCHSNHTDWPWYSHVPPVAGWIAQHVREGREGLDFSQWDSYSEWQRQDKLESICGNISTGRMPPWQYTMMHPEARLSEKDKSEVCAWVNGEAVAAR